MINGVAHAFIDRSPLIAITDANSRPIYETGLRQRINQQAIYEPLVKWSTTLDAKTVRRQVRRAMRAATAKPPGPVHFEFPQSETTREAGDYVSEPPLLPNWITPVPDRADLKPALDMLNRARRPILIAGMGVYWSSASVEFVKFAERIGAPVLTTTKCKGMIPEDHPLRAGCIIGGLIERKLVLEADLIVTVGLDAVELQPKPWPYTLAVLSLSSVPSTDALVPADPEIIRDLKALLRASRCGRRRAAIGERNQPRLSEARYVTRSIHRPPACRRNAPWKSPARSSRATPLPPAMPAPAGCWWYRNGNPTVHANSSPPTG
jgi:acetolactate synthase-1/2/3 large subunit